MRRSPVASLSFQPSFSLCQRPRVSLLMALDRFKRNAFTMSDPTPDSPPPRTTGGNWRWEPPAPADLEAMLPGYTVEKLIGQGGMGAVYKGVQTNLDRPVAIKILPADIEKEDPTYDERFRNEAKLMARLLHPAIVTVFDFGETPDGQLYFVMEYIDGTDIHQMISSQGKLSAEHALSITAHVCDALAAAYALGIVHRDIKPANVPGPGSLTSVRGVWRMGHSSHSHTSSSSALLRPRPGRIDFHIAPQTGALRRTDSYHSNASSAASNPFLYSSSVLSAILLFKIVMWAVMRASSDFTSTSGSTPSPSQFDCVIGFTAPANGI